MATARVQDHGSPIAWLGLCLFVHLLGWGALRMAWNDINRGETGIPLRHPKPGDPTVLRSKSPVAFWFFIVLYVSFGLGAITGSLFEGVRNTKFLFSIQ